MEGIGYWLFIAVFYLLSFLKKRRQQQAALQNMDDEIGSEEKPQDTFKFD